MSHPRRFLIRMALFVLVVTAIGAALFAPLRGAFLANAPLNGLILGVLLIGVIYNFRQVTMLYADLAWIERFQAHADGPITSSETMPRLLAPMARMLTDRDRALKLSALSTRSILDGIYSRLDESRDLSRYTIGLLIFLGLLGTFWGLIETVSSIRDVINGLSVTGADAQTLFGDLKQGLEAPLSGMGTAFSSSLFGLAGSLVLGFLDLQASQAQNRFFNDLEDWLAGQTRLSSGVLGGEGDQAVPVYVQALLEQTAESLENLQRTMAKGEDGRQQTGTAMTVLAEKVGTLTDHMRTEQAVMKALAENQVELKSILTKLAEGAAPTGGGMDDTTRTHIRNLDVYMARLLEELAAGRDDVVQQIRSEIKLLARTVAAGRSNEKS